MASVPSSRTHSALRHRVGTTSVILEDSTGAPLVDADVAIEQTRHAFGFGNIGFDFIPLANGEGTAEDERLAEQWLAVFNTATLPFYWGQFEPAPGRPNTARLLAAARWFREHDVALKGHPLVWHTLAPPWLLDLPIDEIEQAQRERIRRDVTAFAGLIDTWDAINEVVIMPVFENGDNGITRLARERGRVPMIRLAFDEARSANPNATLLLNDFDLSPAYERLIDDVLDAGIHLDAIGLQTHMHQGYRGEDAVLDIVDRFARFGLPIHMTETSLVSGQLMPPEIVDLNDYQLDSWPSTPDGEERQADELVRHYRSLVGHPSVAAITYWGLTDRGAWLGAPIGLIRADGTPKPSYDALRRLVSEEWWLPETRLRTDSAGRVDVTGFAGDYRLSTGGAEHAFEVTAGSMQHVTLSVQN